jgi:soluble lytic murein transglycosylase-like protein
MSEKYGIDPNLALALAEVESSEKGRIFRFGRMGKGTFYGPFGIHKSFLSKWDIADPFVNTEVGIRALSNHIKKQGSLRGALKKYNTGDHGVKFERYFKRIKSLQHKYEELKPFTKPQNLAMRRGE